MIEIQFDDKCILVNFALDALILFAQEGAGDDN